MSAITGQVVNTTAEATALVQVDRVVGEIKVLIQHVAMSHYEIGTRLNWLKENTPHGRFMAALEEDLNGTISLRNAQKLMMCAKKLTGLPKVRALSDEQFTKAAILLTNLSDESLQEIEDGGGDLPLDKIEVMSTRELKAEIKRMKENENKVREEEQRYHRGTIEKLEKEIADLRAETDEQSKSEFLTERAEKIVKAAGTIKTMVTDLTHFKGHDQLTPPQRATVEGSLAMAQRLVMESYRNFLGSFPLED